MSENDVSERTRSCVQDVVDRGKFQFEDKETFGEYMQVLQGQIRPSLWIRRSCCRESRTLRRPPRRHRQRRKVRRQKAIKEAMQYPPVQQWLLELDSTLKWSEL